LTVHTSPDREDYETSYSAGYVEGYATAQRIEQHAYNIGARGYNMSSGMRAFLDANKYFMNTLFDTQHHLPQGHIDRKVIYQTQMVVRQLEGLYNGYLDGISQVPLQHRVFPADAPLTFEEIELISLGGDLEDLEPLFEIKDVLEQIKNKGELSAADKQAIIAKTLENYKQRTEAKRNSNNPHDVSPVYNTGRCSALIRRTPSGDLFSSQVTWSSLNSMLRIWKWYDFAYYEEAPSNHNNGKRQKRATVVPGRVQSFASYPGALYSGDDFYTTSAQLVVLETTIGNDNMQLAEDATSPICILEWIRNMVANRLAPDAPSWHAFYSRFNSGTYNNMNVVIDYKQVSEKNPTLPANTVVISEQVPGNIVITDVTADVNKNGYFASYNIARDSYIRKISGTDEDMAKYGGWFGFDTHPRALIFKRDAPGVTSMDEMKKLMRSCDFKNDPLSSQMETCKYVGVSNCHPTYTSENCIATRGDLNPKDGVWGMSAFAQRNHVATDAKIVSLEDVRAAANNGGFATVWAINGPPRTVDNPKSTPTFVFSTSPFNQLPHEGIPDRVEFDWQHLKNQDD